MAYKINNSNDGMIYLRTFDLFNDYLEGRKTKNQVREILTNNGMSKEGVESTIEKWSKLKMLGKKKLGEIHPSDRQSYAMGGIKY
jgi:hypothetical protein